MPKMAAPNGPGERVAVLTRTTIELRNQLEEAASLSGRSLSQEVERRLERTFEYEFLLGDNETALVLRTIASAIQLFERSSGKGWVSDSTTHEAAYEAASKMLEVLMKPNKLTDDRADPGRGLRIDWDNAEMRAGMHTIAFDAAFDELRKYRSEKEQELRRLRSPRKPKAAP